MDKKKIAAARFNFVLGYGSNGTAGDVSLTLGVTAADSGVRVVWAAGETADDAKQRIVEYASGFLLGYAKRHPEYGFIATITAVGADPLRKNEYERATGWALHEAINKLGLPPIPIFAPPPIANLLVIHSPDIDRAAKFYQQLGLLFTKDSHGSGPEHYVSIVRGFVFEVYPLSPGQSPTTSTRIGFSVDDVDSLVPMVAKIGAKVVKQPFDAADGRRAVVEDLDGHRVELFTPTGPWERFS